MENFNNKNCLIIGFGISGKGAYETLERLNANIFVFDDDINKLKEEININFIKKLTKKLLKDMDLIIISPNIKLSKKYLKVIKKYNIDFSKYNDLLHYDKNIEYFEKNKKIASKTQNEMIEISEDIKNNPEQFIEGLKEFLR